MLVSYLTDKPFRYFDRIHVKTITPHFKAPSDWNGDRWSTWRSCAKV